MRIADLPLVNACINSLVAVLLLTGLVLIKRRQREAHRWVMVAALVLSALFLASYVTYHLNHGSTKFTGEGPVRALYFTILITHTVLAVVNLPFIIMTVLRAFRGQFQQHARMAKRTWAVWMYVAVTGPVVYVMLYQLYPPRAEAPAASGEAEREFLEARRLHRDQKDAEALPRYAHAAALGFAPAACYAAVLRDRVEGTETASIALAQALAAHPGEPHCTTLAARQRVYENAPESAIPLLEDVVKRVPDDAFFWASLGFARFMAQHYTEAAQAFEKSVRLDPGLAANVYNAGYAHFLGGQYSAATPLLERALSMGLDPELKARAQEDLDVISGSLWVCPMHPDITGKPGDHCSKCGMTLAVAPHGLSEGDGE